MGLILLLKTKGELHPELREVRPHIRRGKVGVIPVSGHFALRLVGEPPSSQPRKGHRRYQRDPMSRILTFDAWKAQEGFDKLMGYPLPPEKREKRDALHISVNRRARMFDCLGVFDYEGVPIDLDPQIKRVFETLSRAHLFPPFLPISICDARELDRQLRLPVLSSEEEAFIVHGAYMRESTTLYILSRQGDVLPHEMMHVFDHIGMTRAWLRAAEGKDYPLNDDEFIRICREQGKLANDIVPLLREREDLKGYPLFSALMDLMEGIEETDYFKQCREIDERVGRVYLTRPSELLARLYVQWVINKLTKVGEGWQVRHLSFDAVKEMLMPGDQFERIEPLFDRFLRALMVELDCDPNQPILVDEDKEISELVSELLEKGLWLPLTLVLLKWSSH